MHLSGICQLQNENLKLSKLRIAVFESLACLKNNKNSIIMLSIHQNCYEERENRKGSMYVQHK